MARRKTLSDAGVASLKSRGSRYAYPDPELAGHYIRVMPKGAKSYAAVARDPFGKQVWHTIGATTHIKIDQAREKAREVIAAIKAGEDRAGPQSFTIVAEEWFKRHVEKKGRELRSRRDIRRYLDKVILPEWSGRDFESIRRGDVAKLLDSVEDQSGARSADGVLAIVRSICNWYATRHDTYQTPIVKGMGRFSSKEHARTRILSDDEIRTLWTEANGTFGAFVRIALLTAQRREKIATMRWQDISIDGTWMIPAEAREKGNPGELVLPEMALEIIKDQPRFVDNPYVFAGRGGYFNGYSKAKAQFDAKIKISQWRLHDLRRTARSLMSRAGVNSDHAERVMGHVIKGVEGVYDRHAYSEEKAHALKRLAALIDRIVNPPAGNVIKLSTA